MTNATNKELTFVPVSRVKVAPYAAGCVGVFYLPQGSKNVRENWKCLNKLYSVFKSHNAEKKAKDILKKGGVFEKSCALTG